MKLYLIIISALLSICLVACETDDNVLRPDIPEKPIVVVFESDVHAAVDGYARLAGICEQQKLFTPYVTTVSCGDFAQGDVVASVSSGENIVEIMNQVKYDVLTLGNHEFDFGITQMFKLTQALDASVVCANFYDLRIGKHPFPAYQIVRYGEVDIAYIGFTTSTTMTNVSPKTFQDDNGNFIYDFTQGAFYQRAQACIDDARSEGADYVVALAHLGDEDKGDHASSVSLIKHTTGIDVVLDGHDHHMLADTLIADLDGTSVLLASTGTKFANVGLLTLSTEGTFSSRLVPANSVEAPVSSHIQDFVDEIKDKALADGKRVVGVSEVTMSVNDEFGQRMVRNQECTIGNFCADAFRVVLNTDVAMMNGGGIRSEIRQGDVTYNDLLSVFPYNNTVCVSTITGRQLLDVLEFSVSFLPNEDGSFMHVSGLKFEVDASVPPQVVLDEHNLFSHIGEGERRVSNLLVWDKEEQAYKPVDLERSYTLASINYLLRDMGGSGVFRYTEPKEDNLGQDVEILTSFINQELDGRIGKQYANTEGRIVIH